MSPQQSESRGKRITIKSMPLWYTSLPINQPGLYRKILPQIMMIIIIVLIIVIIIMMMTVNQNSVCLESLPFLVRRSIMPYF